MTTERPRETFVAFDCQGDLCLGVVTHTQAACEAGVVIVVGGPQYRAGSHRQFTVLARELSAHGIPVLRFDYRGMGDSEGAMRTFETIDADIGAAVTALVRETGVTRVVLWGLCDGASAALMYAQRDPRVAGVVGVNPWVRTEASLATAHLRHYYVRRLVAPDFWRKTIRGALDVGRVMRGVTASLRAARSEAVVPFLTRMEEGWRALRAPALFILSGRDLTAREFEAWAAQDPARRARLASPSCSVCAVADADHTFTSDAARAAMTRATIEWVARLCPAS